MANALFAMLGHEPAIYYLLEHRDAIKSFLEGIRFFEEKTSKKQKSYYRETHH